MNQMEFPFIPFKFHAENEIFLLVCKRVYPDIKGKGEGKRKLKNNAASGFPSYERYLKVRLKQFKKYI